MALNFPEKKAGTRDWVGKIAPAAGTVVGGVAGAFAGNPMAGAALGGAAGNAVAGVANKDAEQGANGVAGGVSAGAGVSKEADSNAAWERRMKLIEKASAAAGSA